MLRAHLSPGMFKETGQESSLLFSLADRQGGITRTEVEVCTLKQRTVSIFACLNQFFPTNLDKEQAVLI